MQSNNGIHGEASPKYKQSKNLHILYSVMFVAAVPYN